MFLDPGIWIDGFCKKIQLVLSWVLVSTVNNLLLDEKVSESIIVVTGGYYYPQAQVTEYSGIGEDEVKTKNASW